MRDFGAVMRGLASMALERVFGAEWIVLSEEDARLVRQDFLEASEDDGVSASEYRRRIGTGNLKAYAECMQVRFRNGWDNQEGR